MIGRKIRPPMERVEVDGDHRTRLELVLPELKRPVDTSHRDGQGREQPKCLVHHRSYVLLTLAVRFGAHSFEVVRMAHEPLELTGVEGWRP